jgi:16S rRNA (guanine966-N2)-methyltransferase
VARTAGVRVVAGSARGRRLAVPPDATVRPTADRVREALFNALGSLDVVRGARVLDLFAGSGALGIEALSRGAARATFVEQDGRTRKVLVRNLDDCGFGDRAVVVGEDAVRFVSAHAAAADTATPAVAELVLCDPPYAFDGWAGLLADLARAAPRAVVVVESDREVTGPPSAEVLRNRRYGSTVVTLIRMADRPGASTGPE